MRASLPWLASALLLVSGGYQLGVATQGLKDDTLRRDRDAAFDQAIGLAEDAQTLATERDDQLVECANRIADSDAAVKQIGTQVTRYVRECNASIDSITFSRDWTRESFKMLASGLCDGTYHCESSGHGEPSGWTFPGYESPPLDRESFRAWRLAKESEARK